MRLPTSRRSLPPLLALAIIILSTTFMDIAAAIEFHPVTYSATAILGSRLYIYGGLANISSPTSYLSQFATLSLTNDFDTDSLPWDFLPGNLATAMAPGAPSRDQRRFIVGGSRNHLGKAPAIIFDSTTRVWAQASDLPGGASIMQNYRRDSPGMSIDTTNGMLVQFGGSNATNMASNDLLLLDTNKASNMMNWSYTGSLDTVPALYAPILLYIPTIKQTLIMGGCDQVDSQGNPTHCAGFDTLYTLSSDSVVSAAGPKATRITVNGTVPSPRLMPCAVVLSDNNVLMIGGGDPTKALADAWILNTRDWTWAPRNIGGFPENGIMGHGCEMAGHDQILVIGGHAGDNFMQNPIGVIKMRNWAWTGRYDAPGFSTGVKVGLAMSIVVVIGAIIAGLWIRWRRNKMAELKKEQNHSNINSKNTSMNKRTSNGDGSHRRKQSLQARQQSVDQRDLVELQTVVCHSHDRSQSYLEEQGEREGSALGHGFHEGSSHQSAPVYYPQQSPPGSSASTIVVGPSPILENNHAVRSERDRVYAEGVSEVGQHRTEEQTHGREHEQRLQPRTRPDIATEDAER
ncbi:F-box only protein 42 [Gamsiella multidivaricata]|nr:F-box only protein 42 [Gamsiella multidivaricata]